MNIAYKLYLRTLKKIIYESKTEKSLKILDLGCGDINISPVLNACNEFTEYVGVDGHHHDESKNNPKIKTYKMNIFEIEKFYSKNYFDIVLALDVIEHLPEDGGMKLISLMEKLSKNMIVIFTPNGFLEQYDPKNKFNNHVSGWKYSFFKRNNFKIIGIYGPKIFRKEFCELRKPKFLNGFFSFMLNILITRYFPRLDMSIFCYKKIS
jgi:hypothetical protein